MSVYTKSGAGVLAHQRLNVADDWDFIRLPLAPESLVNLTPRAVGIGNVDGVEVVDPVGDVGRAAERNNNFVLSRIVTREGLASDGGVVVDLIDLKVGMERTGGAAPVLDILRRAIGDLAVLQGTEGVAEAEVVIGAELELGTENSDRADRQDNDGEERKDFGHFLSSW